MSWNTLGRRPCMDKVHWYQQSRAEIPRNALAFKYVGFCGCHLLEIINTLNACRECQTETWQKWETDGGWRASPQALNQELVDNANSQLWERSIEAAGRQLSESFSEGESLQTTETSTTKKLDVDVDVDVDVTGFPSSSSGSQMHFGWN